jgi:hypothetical protein
MGLILKPAPGLFGIFSATGRIRWAMIHGARFPEKCQHPSNIAFGRLHTQLPQKNTALTLAVKLTNLMELPSSLYFLRHVKIVSAH